MIKKINYLIHLYKSYINLKYLKFCENYTIIRRIRNY